MSAEDDLGTFLAAMAQGLMFIERAKKSATRQLSALYPQALGDWQPGAAETLTDWCCPGGRAERAARARLEGKNGGSKPTEAQICAELLEMWRQAGRCTGTPRSIKELRSRQT